jgi:uncharacterized membrane protein
MNTPTTMARSPLATAELPSPSMASVLAHPRELARLHSIDVLRGLVIVLMALDHVRDYFTDVRFDPLDLTQTSGTLFMTRWITHFCAPIFIFLAGMSAQLVGRRCTPLQLSRFLFTRGAWLVVLELTVMNFAFNFNLRYEMGVLLQVIWAIGASMIVLSALVRLPVRVVGAIGLVMIVGHNLLDGISPGQFGAWAPLWNVLHVPGAIAGGYLLYPLIPWLGVMALGFAMGTLFDFEPERRRRMLLILGSSAIAGFVLLRLLNGYGDPQPWSVQESFGFTLLSFLDVAKYPPSLAYVLMTLGPALLLLAVLERARGRFADILETFGRVPLFFYVLHFFLAHLAAGVVAMAMGFGTTVLTGSFLEFPKEWGVGLPAVYVAWLLVIATLYPACRWYAALKRRRKDWWLSYL